jgi:two-component system chemotaxis sensor kinase CheA
MASDPYRYFRIEARELTEQLAAGVVAAERAAEPGSVTRLLRLAHTLKGAARVVRQARIAEIAHEIEDLLAPLRDVSSAAPRSVVQEVLRKVDEASAQVTALTPAPATGAPAARDEPFRTLRADVAEVDTLLAGMGEAQARLAALRGFAPTLQRARLLASAAGQHATPAADRAGPWPVREAAAAAASRELESVLSELDRGLATELEGAERELAQVRGAGERLRLLPASALFPSLERVARDVAADVGRRVVFEGRGGEIRLDGHVLAAVQSALVQAVRNAVAHGIEPEAERLASGKPAEGRVAVALARRGARVAFTCRDDGRGVDLEAVRQAIARSGRGALPPDAGDDELLRRLLAGGVTTSRAVTDAAGRGLGLDVVRDVTARLRGEAALRSEPGRGTELELEVPVSLSTLEALIVETGGVTAAIPVAAVRETASVARSTGARASVPYRGEALPVVPLAPLLAGVGSGKAQPERVAVIVSAGSGRAALGVERVLRCETVVVRPLPALAAADAIVSGLAMDPDGTPWLVLDPHHLVEGARRAPRAGAAAPAPPRPILVVDDSLTTRMLEQSILESAGYQVELATSGEEALEKARARRYSLFLVDVEMPGMDGFALLEHMSADPDLHTIPSLLVTSRQAPEDRARGLRAGARAYIVKSEFDQAELLETIRSLVR